MDLFHRIYQPITTPETPVAILFDLRWMALDGTDEAMLIHPLYNRNPAITSDNRENSFPQSDLLSWLKIHHFT